MAPKAENVKHSTQLAAKIQDMRTKKLTHYGVKTNM